MKALVAILCIVGFPLPGAAYITLEKQGDDWRFHSEGERFISLGINGIRMAEYWPSSPDLKHRKSGGYYDVRDRFEPPYDDWVNVVTNRMSEWGFNTAGAWSSEILERAGTPYCHVLRMGWARSGMHRLVDLFSEEYERYADREARSHCAQRSRQRHLVGYFLDNELPWYGEKSWRTKGDSLLTLYSKLDKATPGHRRLLEFLRSEFETWEDFTAHFATDARSWSDLESGQAIHGWSARARNVEDAWAGQVAERFFSVAVSAVKKHDPNHLILGSRFAANAPQAVWKSAGRHCDVVSVNFYTGKMNAGISRWRSAFQLTQKPILISETSIRASENSSGNPNTVGADCTVATQNDRAEHMEHLLSAWLKEPYIVGVHWFEYFDQPPKGRYNRENSNFGLVDIHDTPYSALTQVWSAASRSLTSSRSSSDQAGHSGPPATNQKSTHTLSENRTAAWTPLSSTYHKAAWDKKNGGESVLKISDGALHWRIETAQSWHPFLKLKSAGKHGPIGGEYLSIKIKSTKPTAFRVRICESNQAAETPAPSGSGESYISPTLICGNSTQSIILPRSVFFLENSPGNQHGNESIDTGKVEHFEVIPTKNQGLCDIRIFSLEWMDDASLSEIYKAPRKLFKLDTF